MAGLDDRLISLLSVTIEVYSTATLAIPLATKGDQVKQQPL